MSNQDNTWGMDFTYRYSEDMKLSVEKLKDLYYAGVNEGRVRQVAEDYRISHERKTFETALGEVLSGKGVASDSLPDAFKERWEQNVKGTEY